MEETALIEVEKLDVAKLFTEDGMAEVLNKIKARAKEATPDLVVTAQGRDEIKSMAYKVARSKTLIDDLGKETQAEWKKKVDGINARRKQARDFLDDLKTEVRKPLTDWEAEEEKRRQEKIAAEEKRVADIRDRINNIKFTATLSPGTSAGEIQSRLQDLLKIEITKEVFQEFQLEADVVLTESVHKVADALDKAIKWEEEQAAAKAEAERLKKVQKEQEAEATRLQAIADEQAVKQKAIDDAQAKIEADKKAEQDRKDREEFERQAQKNARIKAERDAKEAAERKIKKAEDKAKADAEEKERIEKLRPDKDKLIMWADEIATNPGPDVKDPAAQEIVKTYVEKFNDLAYSLRLDAEEL